YSPPSLGALARHDKDHPDALFKLDPAGDTRRFFDGDMWDAQPLYSMAAECVRQTGIARQLRYAATHVVLLWGYNIVWPDMNLGPRFRRPMEIFGALHDLLVLPPALVMIALAFRRRNARAMLLALHVVGLAMVAVVYFGDTRLRAPYDGVLIVLAVSGY